MIRFESDYLEGALPEVMQALCDTNYAQTPGYGEDEYCREAARATHPRKVQRAGRGVHFLVGGTQANMTVIAAALRPHQAAVAAETGHIAVHETGSIEAAGHKVITLKAATARSPPHRCAAASRRTGTTPPTSTWPSPRWCTSPSRPKTAPYTPWPNSRP